MKNMKRRISWLISLAIVSAAIMFSGCNNCQVKDGFADNVKTNGLAAVNKINSARTDGITVAAVKEDLAADAVKLKKYYDNSTRNVFAYWFGDAQILLSQDMYDKTEDMYLYSSQFAEDSATASDADNLQRWICNQRYLVAFYDWSTGAASSMKGVDTSTIRIVAAATE